MLDDDTDVEETGESHLDGRPRHAEIFREPQLRRPRNPGGVGAIEEREQDDRLALGEPQLGDTAAQEPP